MRQPEYSTEQRKAPLRYRRTIGLAAMCAVFAGTGCGAEERPPRQEKADVGNYVVESGDVRLNVEAQGAADASDVVIAVHGGPGLSLTSLEDLTPLAGDDRLVVRYDQRGSGDSTVPTNQDFSLQRQLEDIEAIRLSTGAEKVDLIGRSWGGIVATAYAVSNPERVDDLTLISSIPLDIEEFLAGQERFSDRVARLQEAGEIAEPLPDIQDNSCEERLNAVLPAYMASANDPTPEGVGSCRADTSQQTYEALVQSGALREYVEKARAYTGDVLILAGENDPFGMQWPNTIDKMLGQAITKKVIFEDTGHFVTFEQPEESLRLIDEFLG